MMKQQLLWSIWLGFYNCYMHEQRNNYGNAPTYLQAQKNKEIQMQPYTANRKENIAERKDQDIKNEESLSNRYEKEDAKNETPYISSFLLHLLVFFAAFVIYMGIWAVDFYATGNVQSSYFYKNQFKVSSYLDIATVLATYADSTKIFTGKENNQYSTIAVAMSLVFSWVLWKLALIVYTYQITSREESVNLRIGTVLTLFFVLVGADIVCTIFLTFYNDYIFMGAYLLLSIVVVAVNCKDKRSAIKYNIVPILWICALYFIYCWLIPSLYKVYIQNISTYGAIYLIFYGYPVIDLCFYAATLGLGSLISKWIKGLYSQIHYYILGYGVGMILLVGYTEVQFYYLIAYFIFRNIFVNYVMRKWEFVVSNPPALAGWGLCYFASYGTSFLPVIGVGRVVISKSFSSYMFALTPTLLYGNANPLYPSKSAPTDALSLNASFNGNIFWLGALIIWIALTFSQRYNKIMPKLYDLFYYLLGIYLFYLGISSSLSLSLLYANSTLN